MFAYQLLSVIVHDSTTMYISMYILQDRRLVARRNLGFKTIKVPRFARCQEFIILFDIFYLSTVQAKRL